jgi:DNA-binding response OmpR family regulator
LPGEILYAFADAPPPPFGGHLESLGPRARDGRMRVLVVDDEHLIADTLCAILNEHQFDAIAAHNGLEALEAARNLRPDVVLSDVLMPRMSGVDLAIQLRNEFPEIRVFLFSGQTATSGLILDAEEKGHHFELFPKPIHPDELMARLRNPY